MTIVILKSSYCNCTDKGTGDLFFGKTQLMLECDPSFSGSQ